MIPWVRGTRLRERLRTGVAMVVSLLVHGGIWWWMAPAYRDVQDRAVALEVIEGDWQQVEAPRTGPRSAPAAAPQSEEPPAAAEPAVTAAVIASETEPEEKAAAADTETTAQDTGTAPPDTRSASDSVADTGDSATSDTGTSGGDSGRTDSAERSTDTGTAVQTDGAGGTGDTDGTGTASGAPGTDTASETGVAGTDTESGKPGGSGGDTGAQQEGICLHDLFALAPPNPSWIAWLSMKAFAKTVYEAPLARLLEAFSLYRDTVAATGLSATSELDGVWIGAQDFSNYRTYTVVATYNIAEPVLVRRLQTRVAALPGYRTTRRKGAMLVSVPGSYTWSFTGNGRVLVVEPAEKRGTGRVVNKKVTCMAPLPPFSGDPDRAFTAAVRTHVGPDATGRWPVMVMAARTPYALGVSPRSPLGQMFRYAVLRAYFSDPPTVEGVVYFRGGAAAVPVVRRAIADALARAGYLRLVGLGDLASQIVYEVDASGRVRFHARVTPAQIQVGLVVLRSLARRLDAMIAPPSPSGGP